MKFSKRLEQQQAIPLFRGQWVTYRALKHLIKDLAKVESAVIVPEVYANQLWWFDSSQKTSLGSIPSERIQFIQIVEYEINKTAQFYSAQRKRIADMLFEIQRRIEGNFGMECIMQDIDAVASELAVFGRFIWQAKQLLLKITKKHDKFTRYKVNTWFLVRLEREEFWNPKLDDLVIALSETYACIRKITDEKDKAPEVERTFNNATEDFVRKNEKYFIKPEDVLLVKLIIVRHLPLDVFEMQKLKKGTKKNKIVNLEAIAGIEDNSVINSIYLDNSLHTMYHERTGLRGEKGNIIRIRWYGSHANPPTDCFLERKTRQVVTQTEYYQIDEAIKERFRVNERNIGGYLTGEWKMDKKLQNMLDKKRISDKEAKETLRKSTAIQDEITAKTLVPTLRTVVRRSAFQKGGDQSLRISLDTNLHIINEKVEMGSVGSPGGKPTWYRNLNTPMRFDEVVTLPYAILEVKTQQEPPLWVRELKSSGYLIPAPNFSKFLYGTCKLWPEKIEFTPSWWPMLAELENTIPTTPALARIHEKIPHMVMAYATPMISPLPPVSDVIIEEEANTLKRKSGKNQWNGEVVNQMYGGTTDVLKKSLELNNTESVIETREEKLKRKKKTNRDDVVVTIRSSKLIQVPKGESSQLTIAIPHSMPPLAKVEELDGPAGADVVGKEVKPLLFHNLFWRGPKTEKPPTPSKLGKKNQKAYAMEQRAAKVFFANERTLLSWLNTATFLSLTGVTLITTATDVGRIAGVALTVITILFAAYALIKYLRRLGGLKSQKNSATLSDKYGPVALIGLFCATLILVAVYYASNDVSGNNPPNSAR